MQSMPKNRANYNLNTANFEFARFYFPPTACREKHLPIHLLVKTSRFLGKGLQKKEKHGFNIFP